MPRPTPLPLWAALAVVALQSAAAIYFIVDAAREMNAATDTGAAVSLGTIDLLVGVALFAGIAFGAVAVRRLLADARRRDEALAVARGALAQVVAARFRLWGLTPAEADVALFALKGCSIAQIADLRKAAPGTVRSQLSQVYAKAGVTGQSMLVSLFLDELLEPADTA